MRQQSDTVSKAMTLGFICGVIYMFVVLVAFMAFPALKLEIIISALLVNIILQLLMFSVYVAGVREKRRHI